MVSVPPQQNNPFPEAAMMFDLERLKTDLERYEEVTDTPWQYFLGILSGYSPEEIASQLGIEKTTVKQSLTQRLKPSLIELLGLAEDTRIYWDHRIIKQLISAGYGLSEQKTCITLGRGIFKEMLDKQRELTANPLINANFEVSKLYVPLGLVESKKQERRKDINPEMGSRLYRSEEYEITRKFENNEFLLEVLLQGKSPKSQGKRIAIIGEPGSGKTTRLQQVADRLFKENDDNLVIWVSLADLQDKNLEDFLLNTWLKIALKQKESSEDSQNKLIEKFNEGNVWLLLDGLDEMRLDHNPLHWVNSQIKGWIESAKVILTCRVNVWESGNNYLSNFDVYRNLDFSEPQRNEFIYKFFTDRSLADQLITALNQDGKERIRDLVKNPLRLTLICYSWEKHQGSLPETKAGLYQECVEAFYLWKEVEFKTTIAQREALNRALGELAKQALEQESSKFRLTHRFVCDVLGESDEGLFKLALDLGWLNRIGVAEENPNEKVYAFFHPSFQEYFAALAINNWTFFLNHNNNDPDFFKKLNNQQYIYRIFQKQWYEVIFIWINLCKQDEIEEFIIALMNFHDYCKLWKGGILSFYEYKSLFLSLKIASQINGDVFIKDILAKIFIGIKPGGFVDSKLAILYKDDDTNKSLGFFMDNIIGDNLQAANTNQKIEVILSNEISIDFNKNILTNARHYLKSIKNSKKIDLSFNKSDQKDNKRDILSFIYILEKNHGEILKLHNVTTDNSLNQNNICIEKLVNYLIALIQNSNYVNYISFNDVGMCCYIMSFLERLDFKRNDLVDTLLNIDASAPNSYPFFRRQIAKTILSIEPSNAHALKTLKDLIDFDDSISSLMILGDLLNKVPDDIEAFNMMLMFITPKLDDDNFYYATQNLKSINSHDQLISIIQNFKLYLTEEIYQLNFTKFRDTYELFWHCSEHLNYPEFYQAWHSQPEIIPPKILEVSPLGDTEITKILNNKAKNEPYLVTIKTQNLNSIIEQKDLFKRFKNRLIDAIPKDIKPQIKGKIQESQDIADLEAIFIDLKELLQTEKIALILGNDKPSQLLQEFCEQLSDFVQIDWNR